MRSFPHLLLILVLLLILENVRAQPNKPLLINCGSGSSADVDGRTWVGDARPDGTDFTVTLPGAIIPAPKPDGGGDAYGDLYRTGRVFDASSTYKLSVAAGSYFLRLHFSQVFSNLSSGKESVFDVTANGLRLLSKFSVAGEIYWRNTRTNSTSDVIVKEYLLNVTATKLDVEFAPDAGSFAFVNAMEVVPVLGNSIFDSVNKVGGVGVKGPFSLGESGIETMYRVCVGGGKIERKEDPRLWRKWDSDEHYIFTMNAARSIKNTSNISYVSSDDSVSAPLRLYETARVTEETQVVDKKFNVSWRFSIDPGFDYLVRLHFCELEYEKAEERKFKIYINSKTAAENYDVFAKAGGKNKAFHEDFIDATSSETDTLWVQLGSESSATSSAATDALLNGMEIFKVSRNGNLGHPTIRIGGMSGGLDKPKWSPKWVLIGAAAGLVIFISVAAAVYFCFYLHWKKNASSANKTKDSLPATPMATNARSSPTLRTTGTFGSCRMGRQFSIAEIKTATMNFDESLVIGVGGFGKVYKGETENGTPVAIKRGHAQSQQGVKEFETEIEMLSRLRHRHLVSLIGYCDEQNEMILVYEHMANGTLRSHLYGSDLPALTWKQRLEICIEYFMRQQLTQSSDVYSFGVVLFEVLCARPVINPTLPRDQINLPEWALKWKRQNLLETIIDPRLDGNYTLESIKQFSEIAEKCLADEGRNRPSIGEVLWHLESALQLHQAHLQSSTADDLSGHELKLSDASTNIRRIEEVEEFAHAICEDADGEAVEVKVEVPGTVESVVRVN
ncbi:unnamed protein product [Miscanthus lutarioriparius]|uniref:Protein kinase domain-containing protein n=1 Tax=Miscanthus lutarioriparius TaxID=422564 RepID=A0A811NGK5_9POAL|nr:unnamed protein product [Miscanthus lutarioriparius]